MNKYRVYWVHDQRSALIMEGKTSWDVRHRFRYVYNIRNNLDVPVHECVAILLHY